MTWCQNETHPLCHDEQPSEPHQAVTVFHYVLFHLHISELFLIHHLQSVQLKSLFGNLFTIVYICTTIAEGSTAYFQKGGKNRKSPTGRTNPKTFLLHDVFKLFAKYL